MSEHQNKVAVADLQNRRSVKDHVVNIDPRFSVPKKIYSVDDADSDDSSSEEYCASEAKPRDCFVLAADEEGGLHAKQIERGFEETRLSLICPQHASCLRLYSLDGQIFRDFLFFRSFHFFIL